MKKYLYAVIHLSIVIFAFSLAIIIGLSAIDGLFDPLLAFIIILAIIVFSDEITKQIEKKWAI